MKKILALILFIALILFLYNIDEWSSYSGETTYKVGKDGINNIDIDIKDAKLRIISTQEDEISFKRETTNKNEQTLEYSSDYSNGNLVIRQYIKDEAHNIPYNDELILAIPEDQTINSLHVSLENATLNISNLDGQNLKVSASGENEIYIDNSIFKEALFSGDNVLVTNNSVLIKDTISYDVKSGEITNINTTGKLEEITNENRLTYNNITSFFEKTDFIEGEVLVNYTLHKDKNYYFSDVGNVIRNSDLTRNGRTYEYFGDESVEKYQINVNGNKVDKVDIEQ